MSIVNDLLQQANEDAELNQDMNIATKGGGGVLYPEGYAFARLVEYVEMGSHRTEYKGEVKAAQPMAKLGFALWGEGYQQEDGSPGMIRTYEFALSTNEKAKAFKLFKKLNYKGTAKRFAQLLNEGFLLKIVHTKPADANSKPRATIDLEGFLPPTDPVSKQPYAIPNAPDDVFRLFLWQKPTKAQWDSLFVDGKFDNGDSKNYVQEKILKATDFPGSALEALLGGGSAGIPSLAVPSAQPEVASVPVVAAPALPDVPFDGGVPSTMVVPEVPATVAEPAPVAVPAAVAVPALVVPNLPNVPAVPTV